MQECGMGEVALRDLVFEERLYPRSGVDSVTVGRFAQAMRGGAEFPPITVEDTTLRIADGVHRHKALGIVLGDEAKVRCRMVKFADEAEFLTEAIRSNRAHGLPLGSYDQATCISRFGALGAGDDVVRAALALTEEDFQKLVKRKIAYREGQAVAIKRTFEHLAGTEISQSTVEANQRSGGMKLLYYINQAINALESESVDLTDQDLVAKLRVLDGMIRNKLPATRRAKETVS